MPYKPSLWWYAAYQMFRRFVITMLVALEMEEKHRLVWLRALLMIFLTIHLYLQPFKPHLPFFGFDINQLETLSISILIVLSLLADYDRQHVKITFNCLLSLPLVIICLVLLRVMYWRYFSKQGAIVKKQTLFIKQQRKNSIIGSFSIDNCQEKEKEKDKDKDQDKDNQSNKAKAQAGLIRIQANKSPNNNNNRNTLNANKPRGGSDKVRTTRHNLFVSKEAMESETDQSSADKLDTVEMSQFVRQFQFPNGKKSDDDSNGDFKFNDVYIHDFDDIRGGSSSNDDHSVHGGHDSDAMSQTPLKPQLLMGDSKS